MSFPEIVGIVGVLQILLAYFLLQLERLSTKTLTYQLLNAIGAALILYSLCYSFNLPAFVIELCWLLISLYGILRILKSNESESIK